MQPKILLFIAILASALGAQTSAQMTLATCLQIAFENHPAVQSGGWQIKALEADYRREKAGYFPALSLDGQHQQFFYREYNFRQQGLLLTGDWSAGNWLKNSAASAAQSIEAGKANLSEIRLSLAQRIAGVYFSILQTDLQQQSLDNQKSLLAQHSRIAEALWQSGARTRLDLLQTRAATIALEQQQKENHYRRAEFRNELAVLLNRGANELPVVANFPNHVLADTLTDAQQIFLMLQKQHPGLQSLDFQIRAAQLQRRKISADLLPHVQMWGGYIADGDPTAEGNYGTVGLGVSVPLYHWGQSKFEKEAAAASIRDLEFQRSQLQNELKIIAEKLANEILKLNEIMGLQREQLAISREAFELAESHYEAGLVTNVEYLDAQQQWQENRLQLQNSQLQQQRQMIEIFLLTGNYPHIAQLQGE